MTDTSNPVPGSGDSPTPAQGAAQGSARGASPSATRTAIKLLARDLLSVDESNR